MKVLTGVYEWITCIVTDDEKMTRKIEMCVCVEDIKSKVVDEDIDWYVFLDGKSNCLWCEFRKVVAASFLFQ